MKKYIVLVLMVGFASLIRAQEEVIILEDEPLEFEADGFYIKNVVDTRDEKDGIGFVQKGLFKKTKVDAKLKYGLETAILSFLKENFEQDLQAVPVVIYVTQLKISESEGLPVSGKAEIKMEFYREKDGSIAKLYTSESYVEKPAVNVTATHEERIREVIISCLRSFNESDWKTVDPVYFKEK